MKEKPATELIEGLLDSTTISPLLADDEIYALGMAVAALEKQTLKAIKQKDTSDTSLFGEGFCPVCGNLVFGTEKFCSECGQALKWEVEE